MTVPSERVALWDADRAVVHEDRIAVTLAPRRRAVLSAEVPCTIVKIHKGLGESFAAGELLVQFDDLRYRANQRVAEATVEAARSNLARVQKLSDDHTRERHADAVLAAAAANLTATERLHENNRASQVDLENAKRDVIVARANRELVDSTGAEELTQARQELAVASGRLDLASDELRACTIVGPWAGRVARVMVNEHELVERGTPILEAIDDHHLLAKFLLPSSAFRSVRLGQELHLKVDEVSTTAVMTVSHIAAALDPASSTFEVHAEIDNADGNLRAGMNGSLQRSEIGGR